MKKSLGMILAIIVLGAVAVVLFLKVRKAEIKATESFFPEETIVYVSQKGIAESWEEFKASSFWKELISSEGWRGLEPKLRELQRKFEVKWGIPLTEENIMELFGREVALALLPPEEGDLEPGGLLLTKVGVKVKVASLLKRLSQAEELILDNHRGVKITRVKTSSPELPQLSYAFLGDWLALEVSRGNSILEEVINLYQGQSQKSLARSENFRKISSKLSEKRAGLFYIDLEKVLAAYPEEKMKEILEEVSGKSVEPRLSSSFELFKAAGVVSRFDDGLRVKSYFLLNKEKADREWLQMYSHKPSKLRSLSYIPRGSLLYGGFAFDINTYWKYLRKTLKRQDPESAELILKGVETFEAKWGLNLQNDVFSWMGEEFACALSELSLEGMFPMPSYFLMIEVKDEVRAKEALGKIKENLERISEEKKMPFQLKFAVEEYEGEKINFLQVPFLKPGYALFEDFLIISTSTSAIERVIDTRKGKEDSLSQDANFKRVHSIFTEKANTLIYLNVQKSLGLVREIADWAVSMQETQLRTTRREFEGSLYPLLESLKLLKSLGVNVITDEEGIEQVFYLAVEEVK